jgi:hypothetical protein
VPVEDPTRCAKISRLKKRNNRYVRICHGSIRAASAKARNTSTPAVRSALIVFSNGLRAEALSGVDAFGCLGSLRARSALDRVSWAQSG